MVNGSSLRLWLDAISGISSAPFTIDTVVQYGTLPR